MCTPVHTKNIVQKRAYFLKAKEIISGIVDQKERSGKTNQQIADEANLAKGTVDRILQNKPGQGPSLQTVVDIANAVGYDFAGNASAEGLSLIAQTIMDIYEDRLRKTEAHYQQRLRAQTWWLRLSVTVSLSLIAIAILLLIYDVVRPDVGWIHR